MPVLRAVPWPKPPASKSINRTHSFLKVSINERNKKAKTPWDPLVPVLRRSCTNRALRGLCEGLWLKSLPAPPSPMLPGLFCWTVGWPGQCFWLKASTLVTLWPAELDQPRPDTMYVANSSPARLGFFLSACCDYVITVREVTVFAAADWAWTNPTPSALRGSHSVTGRTAGRA